jgi:signal peptidase
MRADRDGASSAPEDDGVTAAGSETDEITGKTRGGLLSAIGTGLSFGLLALVVLIAVLVIVVPAVINGRALTVLTSSMEPGYPPGTLVVVAPTAPDDIRIGDVLTYQLDSGKATLVTHRVIEIGTSTADGTRTFTTKGDNNDIPDADPVQEVQVVGTVLYAIPYLGYVNTAVNGDLRALIVPVIVGGLLVYAVWMVVSSFRDKRKKAQGDGGA